MQFNLTGKVTGVFYIEILNGVLSVMPVSYTHLAVYKRQAKAYADEKFGGADTAPVVALGGGRNMLELWHGPTCAFKDMALQMLPHLLTASLRKTGETRTACILVATSGDTGKAALDGFHDCLLYTSTDYQVSDKALTLTKTALENFRRSSGYVEFSVTMSDNSVYTLVIDYI